MEDDEEKPPHLPMDIMLKLPAHISDPATLARAASSYKPWRSIIKDPAFLAGLMRRRGDHGFIPSLLLGFFYQDSTEAASHLWQHHEDRSRCLAPSFIPTSELVPSRGRRSRGINREEEGYNTVDPMSLGMFLRDIGASLNFYEPVASQDCFLALCRRSEDEQGRTMPDVLCVCNPLSGEVFQVPDRHEVPPPQHYVLLVTDDDDRRGSFWLVSIWIKGKKLIYRYYCSNTRAWWRPTSFPEVMPGHYLMSSPAAASHGGAIHWLCGSWKSMAPAYLCTLTMGQEELVYVDLPPNAKSNNKQSPPLLASSADGATLLLLVKGLQMSLWKHENGSSDDSTDWIRLEMIDLTSFPLLPQRVQMMRHRAKLRVESFRGKSGAVVIWMEGEGLYLLSLGDRSLRKIDNENLAKNYSCFCPYEIDWLSCLAITNLLAADGSSIHEGRKNIHGRWKTLVAECTK